MTLIIPLFTSPVSQPPINLSVLTRLLCRQLRCFRRTVFTCHQSGVIMTDANPSSDKTWVFAQKLPPVCVCISVAVRKRQVAIIARLSREMSQTVRIDCHSFLSRVRISVLRSTFFRRKTLTNYRENRVAARVFS